MSQRILNALYNFFWVARFYPIPAGETINLAEARLKVPILASFGYFLASFELPCWHKSLLNLGE